MVHRVVAGIDLKALARNYRRIAAHVRPAEVLCVLKANAYGLGVAASARTLAAAGCTQFGVASHVEALELKKCLKGLKGLGRCDVTGGRQPSIVGEGLSAPSTVDGFDIQILSSALPDEIPEMVRAGVILPIIDLPTARLVSAEAVRARRTVRVHFKIDTGMGRLGILADKALEVISEVTRLPNLACEGIFTHCPVASDPKNPYTRRQIARFRDLVVAASEMHRFAKVHMAASDAINSFPEAARAPFTMVRAGIDLHGGFDPNGRKTLKVESVLTLKTRVAQVRDLPPGTTLGYGRTWCLNAPTRVATIAAGYADGLPLALSNRGFVFVGGRRCPIVGRISMDYTTVDVTDVPGVKPGDEVILLGRYGRDKIEPDDWAALKGTHAYDILCSIGTRVVRVPLD